MGNSKQAKLTGFNREKTELKKESQIFRKQDDNFTYLLFKVVKNLLIKMITLKENNDPKPKTVKRRILAIPM